MFKCELGNHVTKPGQKERKFVKETRPKKYYEQRGAHRVVVGEGYETVREVRACEKCMEGLTSAYVGEKNV